MGISYSGPAPEDKPPPEIISLTTTEKETIAAKRLQYLETKYPPKKASNVKKISTINDERKHEQYMKDLLS